MWERIYRKFRRSGEAWASLKDDINPSFRRGVEGIVFAKRSALDIGCGDGRYLAFLCERGFAVTGIDSSETAIALARERVPAAELHVMDMITYPYPEEAYGLALSVAAIHHARKEEMARVLGKVWRALVPGGRLFLIVPSLDALARWPTFKDGRKLSEGTYVPITGPEKGLPHSFFGGKEIEKLLRRAGFTGISLEMDERGRWLAWANKAA